LVSNSKRDEECRLHILNGTGKIESVLENISVPFKEAHPFAYIAPLINPFSQQNHLPPEKREERLREGNLFLLAEGE
jgi:hypothetical protein